MCLIRYYNFFNKKWLKKKSINWGLGIGDWGIGDWGLGPIPNPQSPIPNPHLLLLIIMKILNPKYNFVNNYIIII